MTLFIVRSVRVGPYFKFSARNMHFVNLGNIFRLTMSL